MSFTLIFHFNRSISAIHFHSDGGEFERLFCKYSSMVSADFAQSRKVAPDNKLPWGIPLAQDIRK